MATWRDRAINALVRMAGGDRSSAPEVQDSRPAEVPSVRRWDSAATMRLNEAHWARATGQPINDDIAADWETLVTRCTHEAANNPLVEGVIETHVADVVGVSGPTLEVQSDNPEFNEWLEGHWSSWWAQPDISGRLCGVDKLALWIRMLWKTGEYLEHVVYDNKARTPVTARLESVHPRRLVVPFARINEQNLLMGVEMDAFGRPVAYHIARPPEYAFASFYGTPERFDAEEIIHDFKTLEPGQVRGVPWLASCLQVVADLRDGDAQILDAIRAAADHAILLEKEDPDAADIAPGSTADYERRQITTLPGGYKAVQMKPEHPTTSYIEYRDERMRELARVVGMPLEKIKSSHKGMNFSQSKHGQGNYWRHVQHLQNWIGRRTLTRLVSEVEKEARGSEISDGKAVPKQAGKYELVWRWPPAPRVDPRIEAMAANLYRGIGAVTMDDLLAQDGKTVEQHARQIARERQVYEREGVPYPEPKSVIDTVDTSDSGVEDEGGTVRV